MPGTNSHSSSVIMSFWPSRGNSLATIDYGCKQVGVVQYFFQHKLYSELGDETVSQHTFAYVRWKQLHEHRDWCGTSATVCTNVFEFPSACCFIPVQRIFCRCAYITLPVRFRDSTETVFVASPVLLKYSM